MKRPPLLRDPALLPVPAAAIAVLFSVLWVLPVLPRPSAVWRGYYTLVAARGSPAASRLGSLPPRLGAGRPVVSVATAPASFSDFEGLDLTTVAGLEGRLDPADPRLDPYLRGLAGYFRTGPGRGPADVAYIPAYRGRLPVSLDLRAVLGPPGRSGWRLVDFDPVPAVLSVFSGLGYALLLCLPLVRARRRLLPPSLACAVLWLPFLAAGGVAVLCLYFVLYAAWHRLLSECQAYAKDAIVHDWRNPARKEIAEQLSAFLILAVLTPGMLALSTESGPSRMFHLAGTLLASLVILVLPFPVYALRSSGRRKRTPFDPVPIVRRKPWPLTYRRALVVFAACAAAVLTAVSAFRGLPVPAPERIPGVRGISWQSLSRAWRADRPGALPGLAGAFAHAAYQEGLGFGRGYGLPARGERVLIDEYLWSPAGRSVVHRQRTEKAYDDVWLAGVLRRAGPGSVERMLLAQGSPTAVVVHAPAGLVLRDLPFAVLCLGALAAAMLAELRLGPLISSGLWRSNGPARRRKPL